MNAIPTAERDLLLAELRHRVSRIGAGAANFVNGLGFGLPAIDRYLPGGGLAGGALHQITCGGASIAAATLFAAGILARLDGMVLWCGTADDLYPPGLAGVGLAPDRLIHATAPPAAVLPVMEEALRQPGLAGVLGEVGRLSMTDSRRLALAAEKSGVMALALHLPSRSGTVTENATAAATRWRITPLPSAALATPGIGRARWHVELTRCRGGEPRDWIVEACDAQGRLAVPALLPDRSAAAPVCRRVA